jgi:hypothetical protein
MQDSDSGCMTVKRPFDREKRRRKFLKKMIKLKIVSEKLWERFLLPS